MFWKLTKSPLLLPQEEKGPGDEEVGAGFAMTSLRRVRWTAKLHSRRNQERLNPEQMA